MPATWTALRHGRGELRCPLSAQVVAAALRRCGASLRLVDARAALPRLRSAPGLGTWAVFDPKPDGAAYAGPAAVPEPHHQSPIIAIPVPAIKVAFFSIDRPGFNALPALCLPGD